MSENLKLWEAVEKTPTAHTKAITGKSYQGTSPKPYYLVQKATETFGPIGIGWGFTIENERVEEGAGGERMHIARVKVWYLWEGKRGEVEHIGGTQFSGTRSSGKAFTDEDAPKKSVTDALVKALSMIGFAGDIFIGRYDDSKYVNDLRREEADAKSAPPRADSSHRADNAPPRSPGAAAATLSEEYRSYLADMKRSRSKADLREWWFSTKDEIALLPESESLLLVGERNTLALSLPDFTEAAA